MAFIRELEELLKRGSAKQCLSSRDKDRLLRAIAILNALKSSEVEAFREVLRSYIDTLRRCIDSCTPVNRCSPEVRAVYRSVVQVSLALIGFKPLKIAKFFYYIGLVMSIPLLMLSGYGFIPAVMVFVAALTIYPSIHRFSRLGFITLLVIGIGVSIAMMMLFIKSITMPTSFSALTTFALALVSFILMIIGISFFLKYRDAYL